MYHNISAQYFYQYAAVNGANKCVGEYIKQIALHMHSYLSIDNPATTVKEETTLDFSKYCMKYDIQPYIIWDNYSQHYIYIFAQEYGENDAYVKESCWLILVAVFDNLPTDSDKLLDCEHLTMLVMPCSSFPYYGTQSATEGVAPRDENGKLQGCHMGYFHVITAINVNPGETDNTSSEAGVIFNPSDLPSLTFIGAGRMFTVLAYQPQRLKDDTNLLDKPMGYFSYGRFTRWHIEMNKRVIFTSSLYSLLGCMEATPFPKKIASIHFCNEQVYLSPDATFLRDIYWCVGGTDGPGVNTLNQIAPTWQDGITFQHLVVPLFRGWCDNRKYWKLPSDQNINTVVGHISNSPIRKELPVYDVAVVANDFMTHNNLSEEQKLTQRAKRERDLVDESQIIYHPYFMVLRQPEILGEYSAVGECELYGEINALNYQMGDVITIKEGNDTHKYQVLTFDHTTDGLAFVFEIHAKVDLQRSINTSNFDIRIYQRWRNFDWLMVEYGSIDGSVKRKCVWSIGDFERHYDSYTTFNFTKDNEYTYNIYQSSGDSLNLSDLIFREASHSGWIYSITGYRGVM